MIGPRTSSLAVSAMLLAGCASDWTRSYHRWNGYTASAGPYTEWARCIQSRSYHYLDVEGRPSADVVPGNDAQIFTNVLADCRQHMTGDAWNHVLHDEMQRLLADAHQAFFGVRADINARMMEAISSQGN